MFCVQMKVQDIIKDVKKTILPNFSYPNIRNGNHKKCLKKEFYLMFRALKPCCLIIVID